LSRPERLDQGSAGSNRWIEPQLPPRRTHQLNSTAFPLLLGDPLRTISDVTASAIARSPSDSRPIRSWIAVNNALSTATWNVTAFQVRDHLHPELDLFLPQRH
jgi:hypothetical protein